MILESLRTGRQPAKPVHEESVGGMRACCDRHEYRERGAGKPGTSPEDERQRRHKLDHDAEYGGHCGKAERAGHPVECRAKAESSEHAQQVLGTVRKQDDG